MITALIHHRSWLARYFGVTLAYYGGGLAGLSIPFVGSHITLIWPPTGIALAALLRWRSSLWPAVWTGAFAVNLSIGSTPELAFMIACGNTLGPWLAARMLQRLHFDAAIVRRRDLLHYLTIAVLGGMALNATNGVIQLWLADILPTSAISTAWTTWWLGDAVGALVLGIPLLTARRKHWHALFHGRRGLELGVTLLLILLVGAAVFEGPFALATASPLLYVPLLLLCWLAIRGNAGLASTAALLLSAEAVWATAAGGGPFQTGDVHERLAMLWGYMATATIITVLITVLVGELRSSERRLRQVFESSQAIKLIVDPTSGRIEDANPAACAFYGYTRADLLTLAVGDIETASAGIEHIAVPTSAQQASGLIQTRHRLASGEIRIVEVHSAPVGTGPDLRWYAIIHDITERVEFEDELRKFKFFNDAASDAYILLDEDARIRYVNRSACERLGYTEGELLGMGIPDIDPFYDRARVRAHFEECKLGRTPPFETWHRRKDGSLCIVEVISTALQVKGQWLAFTASRDITERKRIENELRMFRFVSDNANDANFLLDAGGRFRYVNALACERLGYGEAELLQMTIGDIDPQYAGGRRTDRSARDEHGRIVPFESEHRRRDGSCFPVEIMLTEFEFLGEWLTFAAVRDITDRKRIDAIERRQRESLARLNEVAALSHLPLDEQLQQGLAIVSAQLELPLAIVSEVSGDTYTVLAHASPPGTLVAGQSFPLGQTYCDITLRARQVVAITEMGTSPYSQHPCYRTFRLEAYIGAVVLVGGEVFGTVNFSSLRPYHRDFDAADTEFVSLLARWVGSRIEQDRARRTLAASEARLQTIIDNEPECVSVRLRDDGLLEMNRAGLAMLEVDSVAEANDFGLLNFVVPEHRSALVELSRRVFEGESGTAEFRIVGRRGTVRWLDTHAAPMRDAAGTVVAVLSVTRDVTERKRNEAQLRLAATVFTHAHEGIMICDATQRIVEINPTFTAITGYAPEEVIGLSPGMLRTNPDTGAFHESMWNTVRALGHWEGERWNCRKDGTPYAERLTLSTVRDEQGEVTHYIGAFSDITFIKRQQEQLEFLAHYDALTQLPNRALLADRMQLALAQAQRAGTLMCVCYLDLDGFKAVNDELGHGAGDVLLVEIARRLKESIRAGDTVARLGGDEFVLLLVGIVDHLQCTQAVDRILAAVAEPIALGQHQRCVSGSIGVALYPDDGVAPDVLLRLADQAMYAAKQAGKSRYHLHASAGSQSEADMPTERLPAAHPVAMS